MCGRFVLTHPAEALARLFEAVPANDLPEAPRYNICPTQEVAAVVAGEGGRRLVALRWGFVPRWYKAPGDGPLLINARAETLAEKPAFREAARARRCLIPADGFYSGPPARGGGCRGIFTGPRGRCWRWPGSGRSGVWSEADRPRRAIRSTGRWSRWRPARCLRCDGRSGCCRPSRARAGGHARLRRLRTVRSRLA